VSDREEKREGLLAVGERVMELHDEFSVPPPTEVIEESVKGPWLSERVKREDDVRVILLNVRDEREIEEEVEKEKGQNEEVKVTVFTGVMLTVLISTVPSLTTTK
jgi:hypothetical protein